MRYNYIAFEGIDGSGKSTQCKLLYTNLLSNRISVDISKEPTEEPIGELIREILSGNKKVSNQSLEALFELDRIEHEIKINDLNKKGIICISDRSIISGIAYNTKREDQTLDELLQELPLHKIPDVVVFVDTPVQVALDRIAIRNKETGSTSDIYETKEHLERIRERFLKIFRFLENKKYSKVITVDGTLDQEEIQKNIYKALES